MKGMIMKKLLAFLPRFCLVVRSFLCRGRSSTQNHAMSCMHQTSYTDNTQTIQLQYCIHACTCIYMYIVPVYSHRSIVTTCNIHVYTLLCTNYIHVTITREKEATYYENMAPYLHIHIHVHVHNNT